MNATQLNDLKLFLASLNCEDIDLPYYATEDTDSADALRDEIQDQGGFNVEVIYYGRAIEYLQKEGPSLRESLEIADEMGYSLKDLSSEVLASLLASRRAEERYSELSDEIQDWFDNYELPA